jgi:hypothetical protein
MAGERQRNGMGTALYCESAFSNIQEYSWSIALVKNAIVAQLVRISAPFMEP